MLVPCLLALAQTVHASAPENGNLPPSVRVALPADPAFRAGEPLELDVVVSDPEGDPIDLRLAHVPPGLVFAPVRNGASPSSHRLRWTPHTGGLVHLPFDARDGRGNFVRRLVTLRIDGPNGVAPKRAVLVGDVTGDGALDLVVGARRAVVDGQTEAGAVFVWSGATTPQGAPAAMLVREDALSFERLGDADGQGIQLADVTGDGVLDVVTATHNYRGQGLLGQGAIHVWAGGAQLAGTVTPTAALLDPQGAEGDRLGLAQGQAMQLVDLDADGVLDVLGCARAADPNCVVDAGALYFWKGGAGLQGTTPPSARLFVPQAGLLLGDSIAPQGVQLADVTGDGLLDVLAAAFRGEPFGVQLQGAVYVWEGRTSWSGTLAPDATLAVPDALPLDRVGDEVLVGDVTGDDVADVVASAQIADRGGVADVGAVYVWAGGPLPGPGAPPVAPVAALSVPSDGAGAQLGSASGRGVWLADVSGDGVRDVIAGAPRAHAPPPASTPDVGALHVWRGGASLTGEPPPWATLRAPAGADGRLGEATETGLHLADLTGDGVLDLLAPSGFASFAASPRRLWLWAGGGALAGAPAPTAELVAEGSAANDTVDGLGVREVVDVDGDGVRDVVAAVPSATAIVSGAGAVRVWSGGAALSGVRPPSAVLTAIQPRPLDRLGEAEGRGLLIGDVTGDGRADLVAAAESATIGSTTDTGAVYVWPGGPSLAGAVTAAARLHVAGAAAGDQLGFTAEQGLSLADVDGDGRLDVLAGARLADVGGVVDAGALYVWRGGSALSGTRDADARLTSADPSAQDFLGFVNGGGLRVFDPRGVGGLQVVSGSLTADLPGAFNAGSLWIWRAPFAGLPGRRLYDPGATTNQQLGY